MVICDNQNILRLWIENISIALGLYAIIMFGSILLHHLSSALIVWWIMTFSQRCSTIKAEINDFPLDVTTVIVHKLQDSTKGEN